MNILISGAGGLIGTALVKKLKEHGHEVRILTRNKTDVSGEFYWNIDEKFIDEKAFENLDSIIHLAGASVSKRWTTDYKKELYSSRIDSANLMLETCLRKNIHLKSFISASGINYYGTFTSDKILDEDSGKIQSDYLADLCQEWEKAADQFSVKADRVVCLRTAMVLGKEGGAFPLLKNIVDLNVGSALGSGKQWMNWIHLDDMVNMYVFAVENPAVVGKYNALADEVPTNKTFMKNLAKASHKFFLPVNVPAFLMEILMGEMSAITLKGTRASNKKIKAQGFDFKYRKLKEALEDLV